MLPAPPATGAEETLIHLVLWIKLAVEATGALVIAVGVAVAAYQFLRSYWRNHGPASGIDSFTAIRLTLARYLALALEFQLGADILSTAVAPSWEQIGKLGAIVVIRTALNFFLMREVHQEHLAGHTRPTTDA